MIANSESQCHLEWDLGIFIGRAAAAAARAKSIASRALEAVRDAGNHLGTKYQQHIRKHQKLIFHDFEKFRAPKIAS